MSDFQSDIHECKEMRFWKEQAGKACEALAAEHAEVERVRGALKQANSNMEEMERGLYLKLNEAEDRAEKAEAALRDAIARMRTARGLLQDSFLSQHPDGDVGRDCNWGMLDPTDLEQALSAWIF